MLQRNPHDYPLDVPAIPATVQPGETVDWPLPIAGFEPADPAPEPDPVEDQPAAPDAGPEPTADASTTKTSTRKKAASPATEEE